MEKGRRGKSDRAESETLEAGISAETLLSEALAR